MTKQIVVPKNITDLPDEIRPIATAVDSMFDEIYLVGGAVRDVILGRRTKDLDFATPISVEEVEDVLVKNSLLEIHREGIEFGTISAAIGTYEIQITSYRTEQYAPDSRKPKIHSGSDIDSDLSRRDFTINAIALSNTGVVDPYDGVGDIKRGIIRGVGDIDLKFREDPLRILRAFRFVSELAFNIDEAVMESAVKNRENLQIVSIERVGQELRKMMSGDFWDDALNELAESRILDTVLRKLDLTYGVSVEDIYHEFADFTAEQLRNMPIPIRWRHLINIVNHGKEVAGVESIDIQTLTEKILIGSQISKNERLEIIKYIQEDSESSPLRRAPDTQNPNQLLEEGEKRKRDGDPRWMITMATYHTIIGKEYFRDSHYKKAVEHLHQAVSISMDNHHYILENFSDSIEKAAKLKGLNKYFRDRVRYFILASIFDDKLYLKFSSTHDLISDLQKRFHFSSISANDMREMIEHVVASVYKRNPPNMTLESFMEYLKSSDLHLEQEQVIRYKKSYIESKIRDGNIPPEDKAKMYLEKSELSKVGRDASELGFEYYDPLIDYLFNMMISRRKLNDFNKYYDEFVETANHYLELSQKWRRFSDGKRNMYLTSASAIIHAIQISSSLDERKALSQRVVEDYREGRDNRNARRYQIYVDWFQFANFIFEAESLTSDLSKLLQKVVTLPSINYIDEDEAYLRQNRPDLINKRNLMRDASFLLHQMKNVDIISDTPVSDSIIGALSTLLRERSIDTDNAFIMMKNYIARIEKEVERIDTINDIPDKLLAKSNDNTKIEQLLDGETETLEYKSTWSFDLSPYRHSGGKIKRNNEELKKEVIKNIAGMMNKNGGVLLIGVEDNCVVCGLEDGDFIMQSSNDHRKKLDNIQLDIRNEIESHLKKEILAKLSINVLRYHREGERKTILKIDIPKSKDGPVLYHAEGEEIYFVRSGTSVSNMGTTAYAEALIDFRTHTR